MDANDGSAEKSAQTCAASNKPVLNWNKITACFGGDQGATLKKNAALYFDKAFPKPVGVPHIEINGKVWGLNTQRSEKGLIKALCATGIKAAACTNDGNGTDTDVSYI